MINDHVLGLGVCLLRDKFPDIISQMQASVLKEEFINGPHSSDGIRVRTTPLGQGRNSHLWNI
jgi:hypothetical protein